MRPADAGDERHHFLLVGQVQVGQRLVQQQQFRVGQQRLGDEQALLLSAGELPDRRFGQVQGVHLSQGLVDAGAPVRVGRPMPQR